jgi:hypothetical protein
MAFAHRAFVAAGAGIAASVIVGCGSSGSWLSASQSTRLSEELNRVTRALDDRQCSQAQQYLADFQSYVDNLGGVNSTLISDLDQGVSTVQSLANQQCRPVVVIPRKHPRTTTSTTTAPTQTTQTFTNPTTPSFTAPTDTGTTGTGSTTTSSGTTTGVPTSTATTPSTTSPTGGGGLGGGAGLGGGSATAPGGGATTAPSSGDGAPGAGNGGGGGF